MTVEHIEILVEEPSMEAFLRASLPRLLDVQTSFEIYPYQGKEDLISRLEERLRGYATWLPKNWRIVVIADRDDDDCRVLKNTLEMTANGTGLMTPKLAGMNWQVVFRIAVEELEAWYFGDWQAVRMAYPRVSKNVAGKVPYRMCDAILGGTWEAFERELQKVGYFKGGLKKIEAARRIGEFFDDSRCQSASYKCLASTMRRMATVHSFDER